MSQAHQNSVSGDALMQEVNELRARLADAERQLTEAQELIQAIQQGDVDAVVVSGPAGDQVFSLRDAEYGYRALVEAMSEGAATLTVDGTVLYCNEQLSRLLEVPLETIIGNPVSKHFSKETEQAFDALLERGFSDESITTGLDLRTAQGRCVPVQISIRKMASAEDAACCMVVTDLTESKSRDELIAAGQLATSILQSAAEAIAVCDEEGTVVAGNAALEELCGCNPLFKLFDEVITFSSVDSNKTVSARGLVAEVLSGNKFTGRRVRLTRKDDGVVPLLVSGSPMRTSSSIAGCVLTLTDITERERVMKALEESEERFRLATSATRAMVYDLDVRTARINALNGLQGLLGYELNESETTLEWWDRQIHPDDLALCHAAFARTKSTGDGHVLQYRVRHKDGRELWVEDHATALRNGGDELARMVGTVVDISERKRAEVALRESEEEFRALVENLVSGVALINARGEFNIVNKTFLRIFDLEEHSSLLNVNSRDWSQWQVFDEKGRLLDVDEHPVRRAVLTRALVRNKLVAIQSPERTTSKWLMVSAEPILDGLGDVQRVICTYHDITDRKQAEERLHENARLLALAMEACQSGFFDWDVVNGTSRWSPELERIYGLEPGVYTGSLEQWREWVVPEDLSIAEESAQEAMRTGELSGEWRIIRQSDRAVRWLSGHGRVLRDNSGRPVRLVGINVDITERKQAEEALLRSEKLASVGRMAAALAHEINNPLAAVTNLLFIVKGTDGIPASARQQLEMADAELNRVAHMARQSLGFYRESVGPAVTSVSAILESAVDLLKGKIAAKHAAITLDFDRDVQITAVAGELRQVFSNLLANSLDAIYNGGSIKLRMSTCGGVNNAARRVRVTIADSGKGIDPGSRQRLFEPFFTTKGTIGTGLGLWICKQIVEKHGGTIRLRSSTDEKHRGTVCSILLPVEATSSV